MLVCEVPQIIFCGIRVVTRILFVPFQIDVYKRQGGNDLAHVILRGGVDKYGTTIPNYHYEDCKRLLDMYEQKNLKNPAAIIDANHSNSNKQYKEQLRIVSEVLHTRNYDSKLKKLIKGVMVESYLVEGRQDIGGNMVYGKSITDPCIGWEDTVRLIDKIAEDC